MISHGTANAYVNHKCRCDVCKEHNRVRAAETRRLKVYGRWETKFVDAAPVRKHVKALQAQGWGVKQIGRLAGVAHGPLSILVFGRTEGQMTEYAYRKPKHITKMSRENAEKLLALRFDPLITSDGTVISAKGLRRRAEALMCMGYSFHFQADYIGWQQGNYYLLMKRDACDAGTFKLVADMYDALHMTKRRAENRHQQAGITRTLANAKHHGYLPPLAWDDIDNDKKPQRGVVIESDYIDWAKIELARDGKPVKLTRAERHAAVNHWISEGTSLNEVDRILGLTLGSTSRLMQRNSNDLITMSN